MQTTIDLPAPQLEALIALAKARNQTPADLIGIAVERLLSTENASPNPKPLIDGFHLWGESASDGLDYQRRIRAEWDDR